MNEVTSSKLNEIDSLLEMIEFLINSADQEKLKGVIPLPGIALTLKQLRVNITEILRTKDDTAKVVAEQNISSINKEEVFRPKLKSNIEIAAVEIRNDDAEVEIATPGKANLENNNLSEFVKGLSSTLSSRIQMLPSEEVESVPPRQGRIRQLLNKEQTMSTKE